MVLEVVGWCCEGVVLLLDPVSVQRCKSFQVQRRKICEGKTKKRSGRSSLKSPRDGKGGKGEDMGKWKERYCGSYRLYLSYFLF